VMQVKKNGLQTLSQVEIYFSS